MTKNANKLFFTALILVTGLNMVCAQFWTGTQNTTSNINRTGCAIISSPGKGFLIHSTCSDISNWGGPWYGLSKNGNSDLNLSISQGTGRPTTLLQGFWGLGLRTNKGRFTINENGSITMGLTDAEITSIASHTLTPYTLYVKTGIRAEEVVVDLAFNWPDYVFYNDYSLMPLNELKAFIQEKGHLPNVPSAETIGEHGIKLGDMTRIQQEKIEELTLYILELNKRIEQLEKNQPDND